MARRGRSPLRTTLHAKEHDAREPNVESAAKEKNAAVLEKKEWRPRATLLSATTSAPLACRVSIPPLAQHAPVTLQPPALKGMKLEDQERAVLQDLLFVLMGIEGEYIRYETAYNPPDEKMRLVGPGFTVAKGLDLSLRDLIQGMLKTATQYTALEVFVDAMGKEEAGTVNHALCSPIRKSLKDYLSLIAQLEMQVLNNESFTLHQLNLHLKPTGHMMRQLYDLAQEVLKENSMLGNLEEDAEAEDEFENILESLREGKDATTPGQRRCRGGSVLRLLTKRLQGSAGDPAATELLTKLLREASRPYMRMLNEWLHHGNVRDPHNEFLIKEQKSIRREGLAQDFTDEYWEKRYTIRPELVPPQLEAVKDRVLLAGKYLNVVRECGGITDLSRDGLANSQQMPHTFDDSRFITNVSEAYSFANRSLMHLLLTTHALPQRLRSLKHYFFLDRSDFFTYFLELSHSELAKKAKNVNASKLQSLLEIVLRQPGSVAAEDPYKEDVRVTMSDTGLTGWLMRVVNVQGMDADASNLSLLGTNAQASTGSKDEKEIMGYEALTLDYSVPFPLSLIISRNTLTRYQLLFRYVLSLRHLEILLTQSWTEHNKSIVWIRKPRRPAGGSVAKKPDSKEGEIERKIENWKRRAWCLRARMLCFVQQLLYYCTNEVIEPNWRSFMTRLSSAEDMSSPSAAPAGAGAVPAEGAASTSGSAQGTAGEGSQVKRTVDELMQDHVDFLATCLKECMLTNAKLLRINSKVMSTCTLFANYTNSLTRNLATLQPSATNPAAETDMAKLEKLFSILQQYEDHFARHLKILLDALNYLAATETVVFLGLCARLSMANEGGPNGGAGPSAYG
ncbi:hypothetical protein EJ03DRAFT_380720 [Teratosphaeria nubilosa]|uniref:Spindle pole body component n=1 Tax=Teratosphaeria nubilosa TaxID=161662 RepID=A0A6G1LIQ1_9PEZI|nr:hypothetical protein EJ03DRAFT_380720 [Teratosphaeria nubilosa]